MSGAKKVTIQGTHVINNTMNTPMNTPMYAVPEYIDWREYGYVTRVKDQQHCDCSACFAVTGLLETLHIKQHRG